MRAAALCLALLFSSEFEDYVACTVQALVYKLGDGDRIDVERVDGCDGVRITSDEQMIVMHSPHVWVSVPIPADRGWRRFQYRWGSHLAHLSAETLPISWGYVERG